MGVIRWTAKGLKLTGEILDSENVEKWMENKARSLVESKLKQLPAKWLAGESRARRALRKEVQATVDASPTFRAALEEAMGKLPEILFSAARQIQSASIANILVTDYTFFLVVCPRGIVRQLYSNHLVSALKDSAALQQYVGLPGMFLEKIAGDSEDAYFSDKKRDSDLGKAGAVIDTDPEFRWGISDEDGHYYVAGTRYQELLNKETSKRFGEFASKNLGSLKIKIGKLSAQDVTNIQTQLKAIFKMP